MLSQKIEKKAKELGFDLVGFTKAKAQQKYIKAYREWLGKGLNADMEYMEKIDPRKNLRKILPNARSVIVLAVNYFYDQQPLKKNHGRIARYAYGRDYHKVIGKKLKELEKFIQENSLNAKTKSFIDTGPVLERALAEQAGLGFIGKNSTLITEDFGSWVFLGVIITDIEIVSIKKKVSINCGDCRRCIEACPTKAIVAPGVIDSNRCISYQTIENKREPPLSIKKIIKKTGRIFGCDICQEICPHNCRQKIRTHRSPKIAGDQVPLEKKSEKEFLEKFAGSPLMRAKMLKNPSL
jgi:epoxyqueuosine reductase